MIRKYIITVLIAVNKSEILTNINVLTVTFFLK